MNLLVINQHTENFGDDAAGTALLQLILDPRSVPVNRVEIVYNGPQGTPPLLPGVSAPGGVRLKDIGRLAILAYLAFPTIARRAYKHRALGRLLKLISEADVILVAPAGANIGVYRDWPYLIRLAIVVRAGRRPIFHWNTIGASGSRLFDLLARYILRKSDLFVREHASASYLRSLGLRCEVGFDTAFALRPVDMKVRKDVISVVPAELDSWHPHYATPASNINTALGNALADAVSSFALDHEMRVELIPHLRNAPESQFIRHIQLQLLATGMPTEAVTVRDDITTMPMYDEALGTSRLVIGGRYHAVVLAAKNFRPFVSLSYENKMSEACRYLGQSAVDIQISDTGFTLRDRLREKLNFAWHNEQSISGELRSRIKLDIAPALTRPLEFCGVIPPRSLENSTQRNE